METGASQCIHDLLPARRVELHRGARVALKRWQMLLSTRRASEGLSMPWRFKAVSLPAAGCGAPVRSLFPFQEQTLASQPLDFLNHLLAIVSRLFHAEKGIQRGQSCGPS